MQKTPAYSDELSTLIEHIEVIPSHDELELRVAVHDLQEQANKSSSQHEHPAILAACSLILIQAESRIAVEEIKSYRNKPYVRSLNKLVLNLLAEITEPQAKLCLNGLEFNQSHLSHIEIPASSMLKTDFSFADLSHAILYGSNMSASTTMSSNLSHADLHRCQLNESDCSWCDLSYADLRLIQAINSDMGGVIFDHANAAYAVFSGSNLASATLSHANFSYANFFGTNLNRCKFHGTDLRGTGITEKRLFDARMDFQADTHTLWGSDDDCDHRNPLDTCYYTNPQTS